jgi:hypothetical protein
MQVDSPNLAELSTLISWSRLRYSRRTLQQDYATMHIYDCHTGFPVMTWIMTEDRRCPHTLSSTHLARASMPP